MKARWGAFLFLPAALLFLSLVVGGCSSDSRSSLATDLHNAGTDVVEAAGSATSNAAEALARNVATQQGQQQFRDAGHELSGALTCEATVQGGVAKVDIQCTGTTKTGGAAMLTGTTDEIPGASVVALDGDFVGTVDGKQVFTTQHLGA
jgi:hypothetical protein